MALEWIKSHKELENHPKTLMFMSLMDWSHSEAIGFLHRFWWWALDVAPDGVVSSVCHPGVMSGRFGFKVTVGQKVIDSLKEAGFLDVREDGEIEIHNHEKRRSNTTQQKENARERVRNYRHKKKMQDVTRYGDDGNAAVTRYSNAVTLLDEEEETEIDHTHIPREASKKLVDAGRAITLTPDGPLKLLLMEYEEEWILDAIRRSVDSGKRDWHYVRAILQNFQRQGGPPKNDTADSRRNPSRSNAGKAKADYSDVQTGAAL